MRPTRKWFTLMTLSTAALWTVSYFLSPIRDRSVQMFSSTVTALAIICSIGLAGGIYVTLTGSGKSRKGAVIDPTVPEVLTEVGRLKLTTDRFNTVVGVAVIAGVFAYFPTARYFQILTPLCFWMTALGLSVIASIPVYLRFTRRLLSPIAKRSDRIGVILAPVITTVLWAAIVLRLLNAAGGQSLPANSWVGTVSNTEVWGGRHSLPFYFIDVSLNSGASISLYASQDAYTTARVGESVGVQARSGLLGMPWCLGDCL